MNVESLMPMSKAMYELMKKEGIEDREMGSVLQNVRTDILNNSMSRVRLEEVYFNLLKDIVWYNFEREENAESLKDIGKKYPHFQVCCDESDEIQNSELEPLKKELKDIRKKIANKTTLLARLIVTKSILEEVTPNDTPVYYIDKRTGETTPSKRYRGSIACEVNDSVCGYKLEHIKLNALIDSLLAAIDKGINNQSSVQVVFM